MAHSMPFQFGASSAQHQSNQNTAQPMTNGHNAPVMPAMQQQPNPPPGASIPGLPDNLAALLQGVSPQQLMGILQALQSGQLPGLAPVVPAAPAPGAQQQPLAPAVAPLSVSVEQDVDMDKEEGELEEGQETEVPHQNELLRSGPGPSIRSASPRNPYARGQANGRDPRAQNVASTRQGTFRRPSHEVTSDQRDASSAGNDISLTSRRNTGASARAFVLQMHNAGFTFDELARDIRNKTALKRMYRTLGLPISAEGQVNGATAPLPPVAQLDGAVSVSSAPTVEDRRPSASRRPAPPRPAAPADRAEYLAKLAAARTSRAKPSGTPAATQPAQTLAQQPVQHATQTATSNASASSSLPAATPLRAPTTSFPAPAAAAIPASTASKPNAQPTGRSVIQTELIKQRLEALKAEQAAKKLAAQQASSNAASLTSSEQSSLYAPTNPGAPYSSSSGLGAGIADVARQAVPVISAAAPSIRTSGPPVQPSYSPFKSTPGRSFGSLPGLFMASTPVQTSKVQTPPALRLFNSAANGSVTTQLPTNASSTQGTTNVLSVSAPSFNPPEKRAAATEFDADTPSRGQDASNKRALFGQSRSNSDSERVVIEVSDNEDDEDEDEMQIDTLSAQPTTYGAARGSISLPGLQQRLSGSSAPGSPQVAADMDQKIAELKRKIAEKEANKAQARSTGARPPTSTLASRDATPLSSASTARDQLQERRIEAAQHILAAAGQPANATSAANTARKQEMNQLSQRLQQLQEQVARHDGVSVSASPVQARSNPPTTQPTSSVQPPVQHESPIAAPVSNSHTGGDDTEQDSTIAPAVRPSQTSGEHVTMSTDSEIQIGSQATTMSEVAQPDSAAEDTEMVAVDLPSHEGETPQATSAIISAPESIDDDVEMEEDSSDEDDSDSDDDDDIESGEDTAVSRIEPAVEPETDLPDLESRTQVHPAIESSLDDSAVETGDETEQALQVPAAEAEEGEIDEDDEEEYEPTPDLDIVSTAKPLEESHGVPVGHDTELPSTEQAIVTSDHAELTDDVNNAHTNTVTTQATTVPTLSDDLAPELQPAVADQVAVEDQDIAGEPKTYYRPYESALTHFKDYRYHPDFLQQVSEGYKSLTYSHRIDPVQPLCPAEAAGNACRDLKCPNQHFRSMGLTDNQLLKLLGTHRTPTTNLEDKQRWNKGLGDLVAHLRSTPASKDANAIATSIAQYRRDFVGDQSSVLFLG